MKNWAYEIGEVIGFFSPVILAAALVAATLAFTTCGCAIPDVEDLEVAECGQQCAQLRKACVTIAKTKLLICETLSCKEQAAFAIEACWSSCMDCAIACIAQAQEDLQ